MSTVAEISGLEEWQADGRLFAIVDVCDDPELLARVHEEPSTGWCLYKGAAERDFYAIAPYLVKVTVPLLQWLLRARNESPWGVFLSSQAEPAALRHHFRKFLLAQDETGKEYYFRFYDPRVLPVYLQACTEAERDLFFGPVGSFAILQAGGLQEIRR